MLGRRFRSASAALSSLLALAACGTNDTATGSGQPPAVVGMLPGTTATTGSGGASALPVTGSGGTPATMTMTPMTGSGGVTGATAGMGAPMPMTGSGGMGMQMAPDAGMGTAPQGGGDISSCPAPPADASAEAIAALNAVNTLRLAVGSGCDTMASALNTSSQKHCEYYAANASMMSCIADAHSEVMSCMAFYGASFGDRAKKAGYQGASSEVMAFNDDAQAAITQWVGSVWHRLPILDPWTTEMGYGHATMCDTIDFGRGSTAAPDDTVVVYPYDGQTGVETEFNGMYEGPMPPAPPTGWPSAVPINVYAKMASITDHVITLDGNDTPIEHVWLTSADNQFLRNGVMMYANKPFTPMTKYRVRVKGTHVGGTLDLEWTFTTGAAPMHWGGP